MRNRMRFIWLLIWISCNVSLSLQAQRRIIQLGVKDGMSNNYVVALERDDKGYIWIATESGLNRFDGTRFTIYNKNNSGLCNDALNCLLHDASRNCLWIGSQRDGISRFDYHSETFTTLSVSNGSIISNDIPFISSSADGGIWITHYHMGVQYFHPEKGVTEVYDKNRFPALAGPYWVAKEDGEGKLYIGTVHSGLAVVDLKRNTLQTFRHDPEDSSSLPGNEVYSICIDNSKNVWVGTNRGMALLNSQTGRFKVFRHQSERSSSLLPGTVYDIKQMQNGEIWFATNMGGVSILNMQDNTFTDPQHVVFRNLTVSNDEFGLSGPYVRRLMQDAYGNVWLGNYRDGLDFVGNDSQLFQILPYVNNRSPLFPYRQVWSLWMDKDDALWMGGEGELARYDASGTVESIPLPTWQTHPHAYVRALYGDKAGRLWVGTWEGGLFYYDKSSKRFERVSVDGRLPIDVRCFREDSSGKLWIGARDGIYSYADGRLQHEDALNKQMYDLLVQGLCFDHLGRLWVGTFGKGIHLFDTSGKLLLRHETANGFPSNAVNALYIDSKGRVWAATREGAVMFADMEKPESYTLFSPEHGLPNPQVRAFQEDRDGYMWISTNVGISRLDVAKKEFSNYNHRDGLPRGNYMDGAAVIDADGEIYFGSQNGVCSFSPSYLSELQPVAPVAITRFTVYDQQTESRYVETALPLSEGKVVLPNHWNTFNIAFNVMDYSQNRQVDFAYMLQGLDEVWYNTLEENQVSYRNVPPGNYTFKVRTRLRNQDWEADIAELDIVVRPPFYMTWYAKLFYFLLALVIVCYLLKIYKRRIELESNLQIERENSRNKQELNDERLRFYTNITHELRTPLTLILGPLEDLLNDKSLAEKHSKRIGLIYGSAIRLLGLINSILEFRRTETQNRKLAVSHGNLAGLVRELGVRYKELNRNERVNYHISIEPEECYMLYDADMITTIVENLLSNAAKYTPEGIISLTMKVLEEEGVKYTEISVSDTGYGISEEALPHIFERYYQVNSEHQAGGSGIGLALVKGLADLHQATLKVDSREGKGTTFVLRLITENSYPNALHVSHSKPTLERVTFDLPEVPDEEVEPEKRAVLLVVEDDQDILQYIRQSLGRYYDMLTAENGQEGWEMVQRFTPDVVVSDVVMPIMDGIELCRRLKESEETNHIPVILLSAKNTSSDREEGYSAKADSYMTKPFSMKLLQSRIDNLIESRKQLAPHTFDSPTYFLLPRLNEAFETLSAVDKEFLLKLAEIIEGHLSVEKIDVGLISERMFMSHSTIYRRVKSLLSMSINEYIRAVQMDKVIKLLKTERYTISQIASMTGFRNVAYFRVCFKSEFGMIPSEYLQKLKEEE